MPKTRADVDRDAKMAEILDATTRRLRTGGYSAVSVAAIAREIGIAHNAIYWYFPSKDDLVIAAIQDMIAQMMRKKPRGEKKVVDKVLWFVDQLAELYPIRASMHEHALRSPKIKEFNDNLEGLLKTMLRNVLSHYVEESELDVATETFIATVQGSFLQGIPKAERRRILTFTLERLIGTPSV